MHLEVEKYSDLFSKTPEQWIEDHAEKKEDENLENAEKEDEKLKEDDKGRDNKEVEDGTHESKNEEVRKSREVEGEDMELMSHEDESSHDVCHTTTTTTNPRNKNGIAEKGNSSGSTDDDDDDDNNRVEGEDMEIMSREDESSHDVGHALTPRDMDTIDETKEEEEEEEEKEKEDVEGEPEQGCAGNVEGEIAENGKSQKGKDDWVPLQPPEAGDLVTVASPQPTTTTTTTTTTATSTTTTTTTEEDTMSAAEVKEIGQALQRRKSILYVRESWDTKTERLRRSSPFGHLPGWRTWLH